MDKKNIFIIAGIALVLIIGVIVVFRMSSSNHDGAKFKKEYEAYNGEKASGDNVYQTLDIAKNNKVKYADLKTVVDTIENGTGLIYFGFPNCPWCRGILPTLLDVLDCSCLEEMLYVDMTDLRDTYEVDENGEVTKTKEASEEYYELLDLLDEHLSDYIVTDEDGIEYETGEKRVYVPLVIAVKEGEVIGAHSGSATLEEDQTAYDPLTTKQKGELENIYSKLIDDIVKKNEFEEPAVCEEHC